MRVVMQNTSEVMKEPFNLGRRPCPGFYEKISLRDPPSRAFLL